MFTLCYIYYVIYEIAIGMKQTLFIFGTALAQQIIVQSDPLIRTIPPLFMRR
jgi:hypothetical protein